MKLQPFAYSREIDDMLCGMEQILGSDLRPATGSPVLPSLLRHIPRLARGQLQQVLFLLFDTVKGTTLSFLPSVLTVTSVRNGSVI